MVATTQTDEQLVARAAEHDAEALVALLDRHLHPAWRVALAASPTVDAARAAVVSGFGDSLVAAHRHPDATVSLRTRIVGAVHRTAVASQVSNRPTASPLPSGRDHDPVLAAFAALPPASRTALWLSEVEGGTPEQLGPVLGLDRSAAAALVERAGTALRDRVAADAAASAPTGCARALGKLPAHAKGKLTETERTSVGEHLASCGTCAGLIASVVAPRPALRQLVVPVPDDLPLAIAERWADSSDDVRPAWLHSWGERAVATAAALVLAAGLAGATLRSRGGGGGGSNPELAASPTDALLADDAGRSSDLPLDPALPPVSLPSVSTAGGAGTGSGGGGGGSTGARSGSTPTSADRPRTTGGDEPTTSTTAPPTSTTAPPGTTAPPTTGGPGGEPPAGGDGGGGGDLPQVTVDLGVVQVGLGGETGVNLGGTPVGDAPESDGEPGIEIAIPGAPPVTIPIAVTGLLGG